MIHYTVAVNWMKNDMMVFFLPGSEAALLVDMVNIPTEEQR